MELISINKRTTRDQSIPCKGIVYFLDKFKVVDSIAPESWSKVHGEFLKTLEIFPEIDIWDIIDNIQ